MAVLPDGTVGQAAANLFDVLGFDPAETLGRPLADIVGAAAATFALERREEGPALDLETFPAPRGAGALWVGVHRKNDRILVEVEEVREDRPPTAFAPGAVDGLLAETNIFKLCQQTADLVRATVGYDRVMIYRFHPDWTGEVVGEARRGDAIPFRGLRYPASDIPSQARRLYLECRVRVIGDVGAAQVAIVPRNDPATGASLDIGWARLRTMSPIHIEYLANMGVQATLTASIAVNGRLWGLIACHHDSRMLPPPPTREAIGDLATRVGARLGAIEDAAAVDIEATARERAARFLDLAVGQHNLAMALLSADIGIGRHVRADGSAIVAGESAVTAGSTPDLRHIRALVDAIVARRGAGVYATNAMAADLDMPQPSQGEAAGVLALVLSTEPVVAILCFANELVQEVAWGGDPDKPVDIDPASFRLSPRKSFDLWRRTVRGTSRPWRPTDLALMRQLELQLPAVVTAPALRQMLSDGIRNLLSSARDRQALMREFLDATDEGIVTYLVTERKEGAGHPVVHTINRRVRDLFELSDEFDGPASIADLFARCGLPASLLDPTAPETQECEVWTPSRGRVVLRVTRHNIMGLETELGRTGATLYALIDITEFRDVEEALRSVRDKALEGERARTAFLAGVSHELRTPLNAIIGFSELLQSEAFGPLGNPRYSGYATDITKAGRHLLALIADILEAARLNAEGVPISETPCALKAPLQAAARQLSAQAEACGLTMETKGDDVTVRADLRALRQAALNMVSNAVKFTPTGGRIVCGTGVDSSGEAWFEVADNGMGMSDAELDGLFKPFERVGEGRAARTPGAGLGLSLVKAIAEMHGGRVAITSRAGHGTTVRLTLPPWRVGVGATGDGE